MNSYDDIIYCTRPVCPHRSSMSAHDRAAQFSPFAALTGYDEAVAETARLTDDMVQLTEDMAQRLNSAMYLLEERLPERPLVTVRYFIRDKKKSGGSYAMKTGCVRLVDTVNRLLVFTDKSVLAIDDICDLELTG